MGVAMILAYTTPRFWSAMAIIAYAGVTNILLMTLYSVNNMPYSALGRRDDRRCRRARQAQFLSASSPSMSRSSSSADSPSRWLPSSASGHDRQHGWQMTMGLWAALCLVLFLITFAVSKERIQPKPEQKTSPKQDFADLFKNDPWKVMFCTTLLLFSLIALMGSAQYSYYNYYADKAAFLDWVQKLHLTAPALAQGAPAPGGLLEWMGYIVHGDRTNLANSNVSFVGYSVMSMLSERVVTVMVIFGSPFLASEVWQKGRHGGRLSRSPRWHTSGFYALKPTNITGMAIMTVLTSFVYAPTIPLLWAMFADMADSIRNGKIAATRRISFRDHWFCA